MHQTEAYARLVEMGLRLQPLSGKLWVEPRERITPEARRIIVEHRDSLLDLLRRQVPRASIPPCPASVTERAALIEAGDGCHRAEADRRALAEYGLASWRELADAHAAAIRAELDRLPEPAAHDGLRLLEVTRKFVDTEHWLRAIECAWPLLELFAVNAHAPLVCVEGWGLVTQLAWTRIVGPRLERITPAAAVIIYRSGSRLSHLVGQTGMCASVLWWDCPALIGEVA